MIPICSIMLEENAFQSQTNAAFVEPMDEVNTQHLILLNTFLVNSKRHRVVYHSGNLVWEKEDNIRCAEQNSKFKGNTTNTSKVNICDIINVKLHNCEESVLTATTNDGTTTVNNSQNNFPTNAQTSNSKKSYLKIVFAHRKCIKKRPTDKWRVASLLLYNNDKRILKTWFKTLNDAVKNQKTPKNLIVFVNPFGGQRKALQIYEKNAKPLFEMAGIEVNCIISQRAHQITDLLMTMRLDTYDGIVCVGGDGTFSEVFNGLIRREMCDTNNDDNLNCIPKPKLPIGIIPAGSTDTVAFCLHNTSDIQTCAISIILGTTKGLDLASVSSKTDGLLKFYASLFSFGFLGDTAWDSEKYRYLGVKRYDFSGLKMFFKNRGYLANIAILANDETKSATHRQRCLENCDHCSAFEAQQHELSTVDSNTDEAGDNVENVFEHGENEKLEENKRWKIVSGKFFMVNVANISCGCKRSKNGIAPYCHLGDGYIDITLVKHTSLWNNLRLLFSLKSGDASQFPFVENYRTRQFQFQKVEEKSNVVSNSPYLNPNSTDDSYSGSSSMGNSTQQFGGHHFGNDQLKALWNCDGELIDCSNLIVRSHFQLIKVFRRGGMRVDGKPSSGVVNESHSSDETLFRSICKF